MGAALATSLHRGCTPRCAMLCRAQDSGPTRGACMRMWLSHLCAKHVMCEQLATWIATWSCQPQPGCLCVAEVLDRWAGERALLLRYQCTVLYVVPPLAWDVSCGRHKCALMGPCGGRGA